MLKRLKIENFKAWQAADLKFGKVTGFFGNNSAGKSSLLHLLLLLKQTRNATDRSIVLDFGGPKDMVSLGTFKDVVHQHKKDQAIRWLIEWGLPRECAPKTGQISSKIENRPIGAFQVHELLELDRRTIAD